MTDLPTWWNKTIPEMTRDEYREFAAWETFNMTGQPISFVGPGESLAIAKASHISDDFQLGNVNAGQHVAADTKLKWWELEPKIAAATIAGGGLTVLVAVLQSIAPDMLDFLGEWRPTAIVALGAITTVLAGYIKKS